MIQLIVGLGNPGFEYITTRHNAGFWFVDRMAKAAGETLHRDTRMQADIARVRIPIQASSSSITSNTQIPPTVWLLKPQTFMNRSGQAVGAFARFYKIPPEAILVVHDELDLPAGAVKLKQGGGSGGHNGIKDIDAHLGTPRYWRLRIGIGHPRDLPLLHAQNTQTSADQSLISAKKPHLSVADFVLKPPGRVEQGQIDAVIDRSFAVLPLVLSGDMRKATQQLHSPIL